MHQKRKNKRYKRTLKEQKRKVEKTFLYTLKNILKKLKKTIDKIQFILYNIITIEKERGKDKMKKLVLKKNVERVLTIVCFVGVLLMLNDTEIQTYFILSKLLGLLITITSGNILLKYGRN